MFSRERWHTSSEVVCSAYLHQKGLHHSGQKGHFPSKWCCCQLPALTVVCGQMQACQFFIPIDCNQPHHNDFGALVTIVSLMIIKEKIVENLECVFIILSRCFEAQVMSRHKGEPIVSWHSWSHKPLGHLVRVCSYLFLDSTSSWCLFTNLHEVHQKGENTMSTRKLIHPKVHRSSHVVSEAVIKEPHQQVSRT
jgi:hypothetical protein